MNFTFGYTSIAKYLEQVFLNIAHICRYQLSFEFPVDIFMQAAAAIILVLGVSFLLFGFSAWKAILRIVYFVLAFFVGYFAGVVLVDSVSMLSSIPMVAAYLPLVLGLLLGIIGCFFTSFCIRLSIFMFWIAMTLLVAPRITAMLVAADVTIFSQLLLDLCYLTVGSVIGYLFAFRLMRPLMTILAVLLAGFGTAFGAFILFLEALLVDMKMNVDLIFLATFIVISLLSVLIMLVRYRLAVRKAQRIALELALGNEVDLV